MEPPRTPAYFDALYARDPDPWQFASSEYERDKYAATLAALPKAHFARAFEVGCSIGVLTRQLAARCDAVVAVDVAQAALEQASARCADSPGVQVSRMVVPRDWPDGSFDLFVFSEVLYYLTPEDRLLTAELTLRAFRAGGAIVMVNWHGPTDGGGTGDAAAEDMIAACAPTLRPVQQHRAERYRLDVLAA